MCPVRPLPPPAAPLPSRPRRLIRPPPGARPVGARPQTFPPSFPHASQLPAAESPGPSRGGEGGREGASPTKAIEGVVPPLRAAGGPALPEARRGEAKRGEAGRPGRAGAAPAARWAGCVLAIIYELEPRFAQLMMRRGPRSLASLARRRRWRRRSAARAGQRLWLRSGAFPGSARPGSEVLPPGLGRSAPRAVGDRLSGLFRKGAGSTFAATGKRGFSF